MSLRRSTALRDVRRDRPVTGSAARGLPRAFPLTVRRLWSAAGSILVALVIYLSLTPRPLEIPVENGDKLGHMLAYATLMFWYAQIYARFGSRVRLAIALVAMGIGLEFLQRLTGYRSLEVQDMLAGAIGVLAGWIAAPPRLPWFVDYLDAWRRLGR